MRTAVRPEDSVAIGAEPAVPESSVLRYCVPSETCAASCCLVLVFDVVGECGGRQVSGARSRHSKRVKAAICSWSRHDSREAVAPTPVPRSVYLSMACTLLWPSRALTSSMDAWASSGSTANVLVRAGVLDASFVRHSAESLAPVVRDRLRASGSCSTSLTRPGAAEFLLSAAQAPSSG